MAWRFSWVNECARCAPSVAPCMIDFAASEGGPQWAKLHSKDSCRRTTRCSRVASSCSLSVRLARFWRHHHPLRLERPKMSLPLRMQRSKRSRTGSKPRPCAVPGYASCTSGPGLDERFDQVAVVLDQTRGGKVGLVRTCRSCCNACPVTEMVVGRYDEADRIELISDGELRHSLGLPI